MLVLTGWSVCFILGNNTMFVDVLVTVFQHLSTRCDQTIQTPVSRACYGEMVTLNTVAYGGWHLILIFPKMRITHPTSTLIYKHAVATIAPFTQQPDFDTFSETNGNKP